MLKSFHFILSIFSRQVRIAVNKGYAGWTFLSENADRLMEIRLKHPDKRIHILYFGDFDPSGEDMDRHLVDALSYFFDLDRYLDSIK